MVFVFFFKALNPHVSRFFLVSDNLIQRLYLIGTLLFSKLQLAFESLLLDVNLLEVTF